MYSRSASYYDAIYSWKNYAKETNRLHRFIQRYKNTPGNSLLDVACGTGNHITYLKKRYAVEGLDFNSAMLEQARRKHPDVRFYKGDMCNFRLDKQYDVVTCLFSAIGHVKTRRRLRQALRRMAQHLKPGGLLVLEPWFTPRQWHIGHIHTNFVSQPKLKLARVSISRRLGRHSINDEHHLLATPSGIDYFVERLELGLFTDAEYRDAIRKSGLRIRRDKVGLMGRGLYFGLKPA